MIVLLGWWKNKKSKGISKYPKLHFDLFWVGWLVGSQKNKPSNKNYRKQKILPLQKPKKKEPSFQKSFRSHLFWKNVFLIRLEEGFEQAGLRENLWWVVVELLNGLDGQHQTSKKGDISGWKFDVWVGGQLLIHPLEIQNRNCMYLTVLCFKYCYYDEYLCYIKP